METNYRLPKDLNESLKNMEDAIIPSLLDSNKRSVSYTHLTLPTTPYV